MSKFGKLALQAILLQVGQNRKLIRTKEIPPHSLLKAQ